MVLVISRPLVFPTLPLSCHVCEVPKSTFLPQKELVPVSCTVVTHRSFSIVQYGLSFVMHFFAKFIYRPAALRLVFRHKTLSDQIFQSMPHFVDRLVYLMVCCLGSSLATFQKLPYRYHSPCHRFVTDSEENVGMKNYLKKEL